MHLDGRQVGVALVARGQKRVVLRRQDGCVADRAATERGRWAGAVIRDPGVGRRDQRRRHRTRGIVAAGAAAFHPARWVQQGSLLGRCLGERSRGRRRCRCRCRTGRCCRGRSRGRRGGDRGRRRRDRHRRGGLRSPRRQHDGEDNERDDQRSAGNGSPVPPGTAGHPRTGRPTPQGRRWRRCGRRRMRRAVAGRRSHQARGYRFAVNLCHLVRTTTRMYACAQRVLTRTTTS
jgi:hypothetical protein